ncbi:unnamed protein product [Schistocephalus solidus]|uniref:Peptidase A2 domain-containing protein n=1 Tax=Schistocephalus solidus TaxID=70667 RepID=A0A183SYI0_SCHSO|nr:unnamed protein product [Schistocephalus solidus]
MLTHTVRLAILLGLPEAGPYARECSKPINVRHFADWLQVTNDALRSSGLDDSSTVVVRRCLPLSSHSLPNRKLLYMSQQHFHPGTYLFQLPSLSIHHCLVPPQPPPAGTFVFRDYRCISFCSFVSQQSKRVKRVSPRVNAPTITEVSSPSYIFYFCDSKSGMRFLVDTGAQLSIIPPTTADCRCPNPDLFLQTVNTSPFTTFGTHSLSLDIGLRRVFSWIFVVADIPSVILGVEGLAAFDIMVDCHDSRIHDQTTKFAVRGTFSSAMSHQLAGLVHFGSSMANTLDSHVPTLASLPHRTTVFTTPV